MSVSLMKPNFSSVFSRPSIGMTIGASLVTGGASVVGAAGASEPEPPHAASVRAQATATPVKMFVLRGMLSMDTESVMVDVLLLKGQTPDRQFARNFRRTGAGAIICQRITLVAQKSFGGHLITCDYFVTILSILMPPHSFNKYRGDDTVQLGRA